jgi:molecular chaperone HtpG
VTQEQYQEFYTFLTHDPEAPMETIHVSVDAPVQFSALVFVPSKGEDMFALQRPDRGLDLYARRVLITRGATELLPDYLGFCRGIVDSEDLPLNISRETLQENRVLKNIAHAVQKDILTRLSSKAKSDPEAYAAFWKEHGKVFKLGYNDFLNREAIAELLRFDSSALDEEGLVSLGDYVTRAKTGQKSVYYLSGASRQALELNAHLEIFKRKGLEVLFLYEPIDEFALESLRAYKEFSFKSAEQVQAKDLAEFPDLAAPEEAAEPLSQEQSTDLDGLMARIKDILGDKVTQVRRSERLRTSASCLVSADGQMSSQMQKILRVMSKDVTVPDKIMEINADHPLIRNLLKIYEAQADDPFIADTAEQLYESALLLEGYLSDPHKMVGRINAILERASGWYAGLKTGK